MTLFGSSTPLKLSKEIVYKVIEMRDNPMHTADSAARVVCEMLRGVLELNVAVCKFAEQHSVDLASRPMTAEQVLEAILLANAEITLRAKNDADAIMKRMGESGE